MKKVIKVIQQGSIMLLISLVVVEVLLRLLGYKTYQIRSYSLSSEPAFSLVADSILGFRLNDGVFNISINNQIDFSATHVEGQRITRLENDTFEIKRRIDLHGCSFAYGFGENDTVTYPFLLQNQLQYTDIQNYAVPGYGTIQTLLILQEQLKNQNLPNKVIVHYADFHDKRNILSPTYRQSLYLGFQNANEEVVSLFKQSKVPYLDKKGMVQFQEWSSIYKNWIGRKQSAFVNALQTGIELQVNRKQQQAVTFEILEKINILCRQSHVDLVIALISKGENSDAVKDFANKEGITICDMRLDLSDTTYTHLPYDSHPNGKAHQHYADTMTDFLKKGN